jgi:hypothetical protein
MRFPVIFGYLRPVFPTPCRTNDFNRGVGPSIPGKSFGLYTVKFMVSTKTLTDGLDKLGILNGVNDMTSNPVLSWCPDA